MQSPQERSPQQSQSEQQIPAPTQDALSRLADDFETQIQHEGEYSKLLVCLLKEANEERKLLRSILETMYQERSLPQSQVRALQSELERVKEERSQLQYQIEQIQTRLEALERNSRVIYQENSSSNLVVDDSLEVESQTTHKYTQTSTTLNLSSEEFNWVATYNQNPDFLSQYAIEVSATEESMNQRRSGTNQATVLEKSRKGNYWILTVQDRKYLVPKGKLKINEHSYQTVEALFECQGYQPGDSSEFKLIKPGIVSPISTGDKWQLVEPGVLQFLGSE